MNAAVFVGPGQLELREVPTPHAGDGEIVLKTGSNTVCGTDVRIMKGEKSAGVRPGVILGHEISGYVHEIGKRVEGFSEGDLVGINPTVSCGVCYYCRAGAEHLCEKAELFGYAIDGGLAEYVLIPRKAVERRALYKAADHLTPPEVSLCEPFACVLNAVDNYQPKMGDNVLIIGGGPMGLFHVMVNKYLGASQIIVSNVGEERLLIARDLGATATIDPSTTDLKEYVASLTEGRGADVTVVCIGINALFQQALECTRPKGHVSAFAGFPKGSMSEMDPNLIHYNELVVTGGSNASRANYEKALRLIGEGAINAKALHTDTYALDDLFAALDRVQSGQALKVAVVPEL